MSVEKDIERGIVEAGNGIGDEKRGFDSENTSPTLTQGGTFDEKRDCGMFRFR